MIREQMFELGKEGANAARAWLLRQAAGGRGWGCNAAPGCAGLGGRPAAVRGCQLQCGRTMWGESRRRPERAEFCPVTNDAEIENRARDFGAASFTSSSRYFIWCWQWGGRLAIRGRNQRELIFCPKLRRKLLWCCKHNWNPLRGQKIKRKSLS